METHEGWLYLCVVIDLFSRRVVGWSAQSRTTTDLALQAQLMAVWRRNPKRNHTKNGMLSPVDFEIRQQKLTEAGVQETGGT